MIDRSHLRILRAIEQQGSLTKAAESLHLTQSALSHKIKNLETVTGVSLWGIEGRNIKLTQAGEYLLREAKRLLPQLERVDEVLAQYARGEKGRLHIGMECSPCYQWLLKVVSPYLSAWPGVDVDVKQQFQFGGMAALLNYDIDLLVTPDPVPHDAVTFVPVFPYEQVLVLHQEHPLSQKAFIKAHELNQEVLYTYPVATDRLDIFQQFLLPANAQPKRHKTMGSTEMLLQMVCAQRGVTTLPLWLVEQQARHLPITTVRLGKAGIHKHIHLGFRQADEHEQHIRVFIELAKSKD
ncbi:MAG: LysR substrate-binding domain-containing protein [Venatoribacter sp.]